MKEKLLAVLEDYICDFKQTGQYGLMYRSTFQQNSYARWAAVEFYNYVRSQPDNLIPLTVAESFRDKMDDYACRYMDNIMFSVAVDIMEDIVDLIICKFQG